jgi:hypoxanthine phosphoribosyltransferase
MRVLISQRRIKAATSRLARGIDRACRQQNIRELTVLCVLDGAFVFTADLIRVLRTPTRLVFLKAASYQGTRRGALRVAALPSSLRGKPVLIVDTIYDTGETISRVVGQVRKLTSFVWLVVLIEKHGKATVRPLDQAVMAFTGIQLAGDPFLIGYGLDVSGRFRNLPDLREYRPTPARTARASNQGRGR